MPVNNRKVYSLKQDSGSLAKIEKKDWVSIVLYYWIFFGCDEVWEGSCPSPMNVSLTLKKDKVTN